MTTVEFKAREGLLPGLKFGDGGWVFPLEATLKRLNEAALEESLTRMRNRVPALPLAVHINPAGRRRNGPVALPNLQ